MWKKLFLQNKKNVYSIGLGIVILFILISVVNTQENLAVRGGHGVVSAIVANKTNPSPTPTPSPTPIGLPKPTPQYFTSCGDATTYGCNTCLNAVIQNASGVKCGWTDTGHLVNGNQKQYICESGGTRSCPT